MAAPNRRWTQQSVGLLLLVLSLSLSLLRHQADACTCMIVTPGASKDGHALVTYAADSHTLFGYLQHWPRGTHPPNATREVYDWDGQFYLGTIPEANETYNVVGNANEFGLAITESTWGGIEELAHQEGAVLDYGSLIYIALQRSKTAREAIAVMTSLVAEFGYASEGETFTIADPQEVWLMEMIGKGSDFGELGAVWAAVRVPDGMVSAHANQARIRFLPAEPEEGAVLFAPDVVDFARKIGRFPADAPAAAFSFSDVYNPVTFETARGCEARVWDFFVRAAPDQGLDTQFLDYVSGFNLTNRLPLWVKPTAPLGLAEVTAAMRSHYEGTPLAFDADVGAGAYALPYRWRPLTWEASDGATYFNERSAGTQQTGFFLAAVLRAGVPDPIKAVMHFAVDDTANAVLTPFYGGVSRVPPAYGKGDIMVFDWSLAFWVFNVVSNFAYARYALIHPEIAAQQAQIEAGHLALVEATDAAFLALWDAGERDKAQALIDDTCIETAEALVRRWQAFFGELFVKFMDGNVKTLPTDTEQLLPTVQQPGYAMPWRDRIVAETGDRFRVPDGNVGQHLQQQRSEEVEAEDDAMARDVAAVEGRGRGRQGRRQQPRWKGM